MVSTITPTRSVPRASPASEPPLEVEAHKLGLPSATALVVGSIIGTGVFTMPAVMAGAGTSSIFDAPAALVDVR